LKCVGVIGTRVLARKPVVVVVAPQVPKLILRLASAIPLQGQPTNNLPTNPDHLTLDDLDIFV
jgi:hypothetical protein